MPEVQSLAKEQQKMKPQIEDIINELLESERRQHALDFVAWLRGNKLTPRWTATNAWGVKYKGKNLISIRIGDSAPGSVHYGLNSGSWHIGHWYLDYFLDNFADAFEPLASCEIFKAFVWSNVQYCKGCMGCRPGASAIFFGKQFDFICNYRIENPDVNGLKYAKQLIECKKKVFVL